MEKQRISEPELILPALYLMKRKGGSYYTGGLFQIAHSCRLLQERISPQSNHPKLTILCAL